jgi:hypothetical protein
MQEIILSTAYLPPLSWWAIAIRSGKVLIEHCETYPKQTYRNRCHIFSANGILPLSIPVKRIAGNHTPTRDILIDNSRNWRIIHWRAIESAYNKTPYFQFYRDYYQPIYESEYENLILFNQELIELCSRLLKITDLVFSPTTTFIHQYPSHDLRYLIHPKKSFPLIPADSIPYYMQAFSPVHGFKSDLSIIDLIFNEGPAARSYLEKIKVNELLLNDPGNRS